MLKHSENDPLIWELELTLKPEDSIGDEIRPNTHTKLTCRECYEANPTWKKLGKQMIPKKKELALQYAREHDLYFQTLGPTIMEKLEELDIDTREPFFRRDKYMTIEKRNLSDNTEASVRMVQYHYGTSVSWNVIKHLGCFCRRVCKVLVINPNIFCRRELRFPIVRDSEIAPTSSICIFLQIFYTPSVVDKLAIYQNEIYNIDIKLNNEMY